MSLRRGLVFCRVYSRYVAIFAVALLVLGWLGRGYRARPSGDNHYVYMAQGWLEGRLSLDGAPPGYEAGRADDWARVWTVELGSGEVVRGQRCRTRACRSEERGVAVEMWRSTAGELRCIDRRDVIRRHSTWYVSFPPGPAFVMLPGVAVWGLGFSDVLFTLLLASLLPAVMISFLDRVRGLRNEHLWAGLAWTFASPACFVGAHGRVWFTAQIVGSLALTLYVSCAWRMRRPAWAGLWLGLAVACRPHLLLAGLLFAAIWAKGEHRRRVDLVRAIAPLVVVLVGLGALNAGRFDDPFEFGHRYLEVRWQQRMQEVGMFAPDYLARNLQCLLFLWPQFQPVAPFVHVSIHGLGLLWSTPWVFFAPWGRDRFAMRGVLWLCVAVLALVPLYYHNSGQLQFSYRFALDWLPLALIALACGGVLRRRAFRVAVLVAVAVQVYGGWMYAREPRRLFVIDPMGWPFAHEFQRIQP
ncbi:MAG: hypothetical protein V3V08_08380 [Nannocystaceae bacterium]